jgi:hypothetical protein
LCHDVSCYVVSWRVVLCCVMTCHVMLCHDVSCYVVPWRVMLCCVMSCCVVLCHDVSCYVVSWRVVLCCVMTCRVMLCHDVSCYVVSWRVVLCCVMSCRVVYPDHLMLRHFTSLWIIHLVKNCFNAALKFRSRVKTIRNRRNAEHRCRSNETLTRQLAS